jgi:hypothetical protein
MAKDKKRKQMKPSPSKPTNDHLSEEIVDSNLMILPEKSPQLGLPESPKFQSPRKEIPE